ncbi:MAG: sensor histidine kinase [Actinomycetota bacterium]|nr:sensor histidine kinase [Actinomycetota bacterium]
MAGAAGAALTLLVIIVPFVRFAYDNASLHLALETTEGLIAALLAYLALKRHRASGRLQHALLAWVFAVLAFTNLVLSAGPLVAEGGRPGGWFTWATLGLRLLAVGALCAIPFLDGRVGPGGTRLGRAVLLLTGATVAAVSLGAAAADAWLAEPFGQLVSPEDLDHPWTVGHPLVVVIQLLGVGLYAGAAAGFTRQARAQADELLRWLGAGAVLGAFARLHYFLFPSLYSTYVYTGDLLRLGSYLLFLAGAAREIDLYWRDQTRLAAVEERGRLARDLHDGLAQELAFIRSQTAAMAAGMAVPGMEQHVSEAADRALVESRRAVAALSGDDGAEPLSVALAHAAEEVAARAGADVTVEAVEAPALSPDIRDALLRVTREAAGNAVRHGGARTISVRLWREQDGLRLTVDDDGNGFDPLAVRRGYGLRSMRERAGAIGGELEIRSRPGSGATVEVLVPERMAGR